MFSLFNKPKSDIAIPLDPKTLRNAADRLNWRYNNVKMRGHIPPIHTEYMVVAQGFRLKQAQYPPKLSQVIASLDLGGEKSVHYTDNPDLLQKWGNFALAYELGRYAQGYDGVDDFEIGFEPRFVTDILADKKPQSELEEKQQAAVKFAAYLVMPDRMLEEWSEGFYRHTTKNERDARRFFAASYIVPEDVTDLRKTLPGYTS